MTSENTAMPSVSLTSSDTPAADPSATLSETTTPASAMMSGQATDEDQNPATSESTFLRLQKQRPLHTTGSLRKEGSRPSDIMVSPAPTYDFQDPNATSDLTPSQIIRQAAMDPRRSSSPRAGMSPRAVRAASPRHLSPATSQIFERDVQQESGLGVAELSPAIPSHIQTEDHIPPVLEASSEVITNSRLDPEDVEIVTHASHQSAALSMAGSGILGSSGASAFGDGQISHAPSVNDLGLGFVPDQQDDGSSSYGAVDPTDPRRLSFISFADVVHAEHADASKEATGLGSASLMSPSSFTGSLNSPRTSSPAHSPAIRDRVPLKSSSPVSDGHEASPTRGGGGGGSITSSHGVSQHGDLTIQSLAATLESPAKAELIPTHAGTPPQA